MAMGYITGTSMVTPSTTPNMSLPLSMSRPIDVEENTPNLEEVQGFPVVRVGGGFHFHQDPISGQLYRMTDDFHGQIPQILANRRMMSTTMTDVGGTMTGGTMTGGTMTGGTTMTQTIPTQTSPQSEINEYMNLSAERYSSVSQFNDIIKNLNVSDTTSFTQPVTDISQDSFVPTRNQDYSVGNYVGSTYTGGYMNIESTPTLIGIDQYDVDGRTVISNLAIDSFGKTLEKGVFPINKFSSDIVSTKTYVAQQYRTIPLNVFGTLSVKPTLSSFGKIVSMPMNKFGIDSQSTFKFSYRTDNQKIISLTRFS